MPTYNVLKTNICKHTTSAKIIQMDSPCISILAMKRITQFLINVKFKRKSKSTAQTYRQPTNPICMYTFFCSGIGIDDSFKKTKKASTYYYRTAFFRESLFFAVGRL